MLSVKYYFIPRITEYFIDFIYLNCLYEQKKKKNKLKNFKIHGRSHLIQVVPRIKVNSSQGDGSFPPF